MMKYNGRKMMAPKSEKAIPKYFGILGIKKYPEGCKLSWWEDDTVRDLDHYFGKTVQTPELVGKDIDRDKLLEIFTINEKNETAVFMAHHQCNGKENDALVKKFATILALDYQIESIYNLIYQVGVSADLVDEFMGLAREYDDKKNNVKKSKKDEKSKKVDNTKGEKKAGYTEPGEKSEDRPQYDFQHKDAVDLPETNLKGFVTTVRRIDAVLNSLMESEETKHLFNEDTKFVLNEEKYYGPSNFAIESVDGEMIIWIHRNLNSDDPTAMTYSIYISKENDPAAKRYENEEKGYHRESQKRKKAEEHKANAEKSQEAA